MPSYTIKQPIVLGFLTHNDSYDRIILPGEGYLRFNGYDIVYVDKDGSEHISHTSNDAIDVWSERGILEMKHE